MRRSFPKRIPLPIMPDHSVLLAPISDDAPCGEDLSFSSEFDAIQEARREDDPSLDQGDWVTTIKTADWKAAAQLCHDLLVQRSKDIRLGVWLVEARAKLDGPAGLVEGLGALSALIEDLDQRGMLADTTIVMWGEFGRTPRVNSGAGRDHWSKLSMGFLAGGGLKTGQAIGSSTRFAERRKKKTP